MRRNISNIQQDEFLTGLEAWVNEAPEGERDSRAEAKRRIVECKNSGAKFLFLEQLGLSSLPKEIGNLTDLTHLFLTSNLLRTLPKEIGNLTALTRLFLERNQLSTLPNSLLTRRETALTILLEENLITAAEAERLSILSLGSRVSLRVSIHDYVPFSTAEQEALVPTIKDNILSQSLSEEERKELQTFFESTSSYFKRFLAQCRRTEGWKSHEEEMTRCLFEIFRKMSQSEAVKTKCETLAATAFGTCGDRVALAFVQMQLSLNLSNKKLEEMTVQEVYDYARQESVIKFLSEKSEAKVEQIKTVGGFLDEIETHLAYLQIGPALGLDLKANGMLYQRCSNVTEKDLEATKTEFLALDRERLIAEHIYEDGDLRRHPFVQKIIAEVTGREEFDADAKEAESDQDYYERAKGLTAAVAQATISEIQTVITAEARSADEQKDDSAPRGNFVGRLRGEVAASENQGIAISRLRDALAFSSTQEVVNPEAPGQSLTPSSAQSTLGNIERPRTS